MLNLPMLFLSCQHLNCLSCNTYFMSLTTGLNSLYDRELLMSWDDPSNFGQLVQKFFFNLNYICLPLAYCIYSCPWSHKNLISFFFMTIQWIFKTWILTQCAIFILHYTDTVMFSVLFVFTHVIWTSSFIILVMYLTS